MIFKNIRLSYLDELENDPEVAEALYEQSPEAYLSEWKSMPRPSAKSDWPQWVQDLPARGSDGFFVPRFIAVWDSEDAGYIFSRIDPGSFNWKVHSEFWTNSKYEVVAFFNPSAVSILSEDEKKKILILGSMILDGKLPDLPVDKHMKVRDVIGFYDKEVGGNV